MGTRCCNDAESTSMIRRCYNVVDYLVWQDKRSTCLIIQAVLDVSDREPGLNWWTDVFDYAGLNLLITQLQRRGQYKPGSSVSCVWYRGPGVGGAVRCMCPRQLPPRRAPSPPGPPALICTPLNTPDHNGRHLSASAELSATIQRHWPELFNWFLLKCRQSAFASVPDRLRTLVKRLYGDGTTCSTAAQPRPNLSTFRRLLLFLSAVYHICYRDSLTTPEWEGVMFLAQTLMQRWGNVADVAPTLHQRWPNLFPLCAVILGFYYNLRRLQGISRPLSTMTCYSYVSDVSSAEWTTCYYSICAALI